MRHEDPANKCAFCGVFFTNSQDRKEHVVLYHPNQASEEWKKEVLGDTYAPPSDRGAEQDRFDQFRKTNRYKRFHAGDTTQLTL